MKKRILILAIGCILTSALKAQGLVSTRYWYKKGEDTIYCKKILPNYSVIPGSTLTYITDDNKIITLSKDDCRNIKCYGIGPEIFDRIQVNPKKPNRMVFVQRYTDGALRVNTSQSDMFYVRLPDGMYYISSSKNIRNTILPFLNTCDQIRANYKNQKYYDYSTKYILDMILTYNKECPQIE